MKDDKDYRNHAEVIVVHQKTIITEFKYKHQQAQRDWLLLMGLMETWDIEYDG